VNAVPVICALLSLPVGWFGGVLIDRVPDDEPLRPLPGVRLGGWYLSVQIATLIRFEQAPALLIAGFLLLTAMLVTVSVIDINCYRLPDRIVLPTLGASLVLVVVESLREGQPGRIKYAAVGAGIYFGFLLVVHLISPNGMGFGDVKLALIMGLCVGWLATDYTGVAVLVLWSMLVGFLTGSLLGIVLLVRRGKSRHIPFGPFLAFGCLTVVLLAPHLTTVVLSF
jgi:prepilin signal peptidase PulO-like enzyme (type II secretory pathway)